MQQQKNEKDEWRFFYNYGTFIEAELLKRKQPFHEKYAFVVLEKVKNQCPVPFANACFMVAIINEDNERIAQADIRLFWLTRSTPYTSQEFIIGFDDVDTDTHTASMALLKNVLPENGLSQGAAVYIDALDTAPDQKDREKLFDLLLEAIKLASCELTKGVAPKFWLMHFCEGMYPNKNECLQIGHWFKRNPLWLSNASQTACVFSAMKHEFLGSHRVYSENFLPQI